MLHFLLNNWDNEIDTIDNTTAIRKIKFIRFNISANR
jgi:hypothetical protein